MSKLEMIDVERNMERVQELLLDEFLLTELHRELSNRDLCSERGLTPRAGGHSLFVLPPELKEKWI